MNILKKEKIFRILNLTIFFEFILLLVREFWGPIQTEIFGIKLSLTSYIRPLSVITALWLVKQILSTPSPFIIKLFDFLSAFLISFILLDIFLLNSFSYSMLDLQLTSSFLDKALIFFGGLWIIKILLAFSRATWLAPYNSLGLSGKIIYISLLSIFPLHWVPNILSTIKIRQVFLAGICCLILLLGIASILSLYASLHQGLKGYYYDNPSWQGSPFLTALDKSFDLDVIRRRYPELLQRNFSIIWEGWLSTPRTGRYHFTIEGDDGVELFIDGVLQLKNSVADPPEFKKKSVELDVDKDNYAITVKYFQKGGKARLNFRWIPPHGREQNIPVSSLFAKKPTPLKAFFSRSYFVAGIQIFLTGLLALIACINFCLGIQFLRRRPAIQRYHRIVQQETTALGLIILVGFVARLIMTLGTTGILWPDSFVYYYPALSIANNFDFSSHSILHTPLYLLFLAFFLSFGETAQLGILIIIAQRILGIFSTIFFYKIARKIFNPTVAFYSSLLFTLHTVLLYYETVVQTEMLFIFFLSLLLYYFLNVLEENSSKGYVLLGALGGLLALTRPIGQFFIFCMLFIIWFKARNVHKIISSSVLVLITYLAVIFPWMFVNHKTYGFWGISREQGLNLFMRVLEIDKLRAVDNTRYPTVKQVYEEESLKTKRAVYHAVKNRLIFKLGYSHLEADQAMFSFALETLLAHPYRFTVNTFKQWYEIFANARNSVHICSSPYVPYLCCQWTQGWSVDAFPNRPTTDFPHIKKGIYHFFTKGYVRMKVIVVFCLIGIIFYFSSERCSKVYGAMLLVTLWYFTSIPSIFNLPQDRYRLPIDALLFMLAIWGVYRLCHKKVFENTAE